MCDENTSTFVTVFVTMMLLSYLVCAMMLLSHLVCDYLGNLMYLVKTMHPSFSARSFIAARNKLLLLLKE